MVLASLVLSLLFSIYSAACDLKYRKITNKSLLIMGSVSLIVLFLRVGFVMGIKEIASLFPIWLVLFLLFLFKITGAADVKLLYIISLLTGRTGIIKVIIFTGIGAFILGIIYLIRRKKKMPFAVAIFIGMVVYFYGKITCHL